MFSPVPFERVLIPELEVSEPVLQHGDVYKISIIQDYPTFLVEFPWLINKYDVYVNKYPTFKVYLEPYGNITNDLADFINHVEVAVQQRLAKFKVTLRKSVEQEESSQMRYITVRVPPSKGMYQCFDVTNNNTPCDLNDVKRGSYVKLVVDISEAWVDTGKSLFGLNIRLFQLQMAQCPLKVLSTGGKTTLSTKPQAVNAPTKQKEAPKKAFVPNLDEIIKKRKQLTKLSVAD